MRRWLVTGARGMLGTDLLEVLAQRQGEDETIGVDLPDLDITEPAAVAEAVAGTDFVVNCAAWTDVDGAESREADAFLVNAVGPSVLARACAASGAWLLHISTDYVFAGGATEPYPEDAILRPQSAYGRTKAAGEWAVRAYLPSRSWVLRSAWLYGWRGGNFISTILRLLNERDTVDVVADQHGQPTWTVDLANRIVDSVVMDAPPGIYHATAAGHTTWFGLAREVLRLTGDDRERIRPISTAAFPRPAPRPGWSVLGHQGWAAAGLAPLRGWDDALADALSHR